MEKDKFQLMAENFVKAASQVVTADKCLASGAMNWNDFEHIRQSTADTLAEALRSADKRSAAEK